MRFYESGCLLHGPDVSLLFREGGKRWLSSLGLCGPADKTSRPFVVTSWRGKLAEMELTNVNHSLFVGGKTP